MKFPLRNPPGSAPLICRSCVLFETCTDYHTPLKRTHNSSLFLFHQNTQKPKRRRREDLSRLLKDEKIFYRFKRQRSRDGNFTFMDNDLMIFFYLIMSLARSLRPELTFNRCLVVWWLIRVYDRYLVFPELNISSRGKLWNGSFMG